MENCVRNKIPKRTRKLKSTKVKKVELEMMRIELGRERKAKEKWKRKYLKMKMQHLQNNNYVWQKKEKKIVNQRN